MNEKYSKHQQNEKNLRKLVRSPDIVQPRDFDTLFHPPSVSQATVAIGKAQNDHQTPPPPVKSRSPQSQPCPISSGSRKCTTSTSLPPSLSAPSIALLRKPSISIKHSEDDDCDSHKATTAQANNHQLEYSKLIDKSLQQQQQLQHVDQSSNKSSSPINSNVNIHQQQQSSFHPTPQQLHNWFTDSKASPATVYDAGSAKFDIFPQQQTQPSGHDRTTAHDFASSFVQTTAAAPTRGQMIFNHNNPFLSDSFEATATATSTSDVNGSFFTIDDANESNFLYLVETTTTASSSSTTMAATKGSNGESSVEDEELSLKDKRENFATTSTKFCLVVSPPMNKFQVSCNVLRCIELHTRPWDQEIPRRISLNDSFN